MLLIQTLQSQAENKRIIFDSKTFYCKVNVLLIIRRISMRYFKQHPFILFLLVHFLVWSLIPLLRRSIPMDSIEAVIWGQYCTWGTNKHPPLSGFWAYGAYVLSGGSAYAIYALSQVFSVLGLIYVYKLASEILNREKAIYAAMILEGVIYYGFSAAEFNVNVISLALWPMTAYYFYQALKDEKSSDWTLTGVFAGLNLLNKYVGGVLLLAMALMMILDKQARQRLKTFGPYWAGILCLLTIVPHILWLWHHDFYVIDYFLGRSGKADFDNLPLLRHIVYPLKFAAAQILFASGALLIYFFSTRKAPRENKNLSELNRSFMIFAGVLPLLIMILISAVGGIKLKSMWGYPALFMLGILLFAFFPYKLTDQLKKRILAGVYGIMGLLAVAQSCILIFNKSDKMHLDAPAYGKIVERLWQEEAGNKPFKYVAGDVWWADNAALYAPSKPKPVIWGDIKKNPWFSGEDFEHSGALLITAGKGEYEAAAEILKNVTEPRPLEMTFTNRIGKNKHKTIYYGFFNVK